MSDTSPAERIGVIGAGVMGAGIAQVMAVAGCPVVLQDISATALERAEHEIREGRFGLAAAVRRDKLTVAGADEAAGRVTYASDLESVADVDVVIEAVPEDIGLKVTMFRRLDALVGPSTILASNSSGFPIAALAAATDRPDRVIGWHWASPALAMRLAEIVRTDATSQATVDRVCRLAAAAGKNPIVVQDAPMSWGYVANRIYAAAHREAQRVVSDGVATPEQVDGLLIDCFRWPTGPYGMSAGARGGWSG